MDKNIWFVALCWLYQIYSEYETSDETSTYYKIDNSV